MVVLHSCIVLRWQKISTQFLLPNVSPWSRSNLAYIDQSLPPQILPQCYPSHRWIKHRRHLMVNCGRDTTIVKIQWTAYRKLALLFQMVPSLIPYDLPFSKMWLANAPQGHFATRAAIWWIWWKTPTSCVLCKMSLWAKRCHLLPNYFGRCLRFS